MIILGIETSCDETAAAVVADGSHLLSNVVASSMDLHRAYGGVVPEIAARSHLESIMPVIDQALGQAFPAAAGRTKKAAPGERQTERAWRAIDGVAVTYGAGLGGSLLVGVMTARTLALVKNKPLYAINHVEAHIYANFITRTNLPGYKLTAAAPAFPMLGLIVSGGHSQLVLWRDHFNYTLLGQTRDDAVGEAFDKVARLLGLPYPGGPSVGQAARQGDPFRFNFPEARLTTIGPGLAELRRQSPFPGRRQEAAKHGYDFSFSGPKTAVLRALQRLVGVGYEFPSQKLAERLSEAQKADVAASFQRSVIETVVSKTVAAYDEFRPRSVVIGGGVAASAELRRLLAKKLPLKVNYQDPKLMTDNGAMVATLGCFKAQANRPVADPYSLQIEPNLSM